MPTKQTQPAAKAPVVNDAAYGLTFFCDDIRPEGGGKLSYMGVYRESIMVQSAFPVPIAKFVVAINYTERVGRLSEDLLFRVTMPGDDPAKPAFEARVPKEVRSQIPVNPNQDPDDEQVQVFNLHAVMMNVVLKEKGLIQVRCICGDTVTKLGSLRIDQAEGVGE
jgi:hypothetical protein